MLTNSDRVIFTHIYTPNFVMHGQIVLIIISLDMQNHNKSNFNVYLLYTNIIISYSFKRLKFEIIKCEHSVVAAMLEITQDALLTVVVRVQTFEHFNMFLLNIH